MVHVVIDKAMEATRAVNRLLSSSSSGIEALLEVIQDCFLLPKVDSDGEWRVADDLANYLSTCRNR